jgi:hypothetical protein
MQEDFHYYATYCAAYLAGFNHEQSMDICYSAQFVDLCSRSLLSSIGANQDAATTQLQLELMDAQTDLLGLQDITRIWASFHFLPRDLEAQKGRRNKRYMNKYRLICGPNGELVAKTVRLARGKSLQHVGIAMHVLADTWAHANFAGTPSLVINNTDKDFFEIVEQDGQEVERRIKFRHSPSAPDDLEKGIYTNSVFQNNENSIMNLGHGRAGHLPDYSFARYRYLPAWGDYAEVIKDNPSDYVKAFTQMIYAMRYLRDEEPVFELNTYDSFVMGRYGERIREIICKRQHNASADWKAFGEELSGETIDDFDVNRYLNEYVSASKEGKDDTFMGQFIKGAISQKGMVTDAISKSGNTLAGFSKRMKMRYVYVKDSED